MASSRISRVSRSTKGSANLGAREAGGRVSSATLTVTARRPSDEAAQLRFTSPLRSCAQKFVQSPQSSPLTCPARSPMVFKDSQGARDHCSTCGTQRSERFFWQYLRRQICVVCDHRVFIASAFICPNPLLAAPRAATASHDRVPETWNSKCPRIALCCRSSSDAGCVAQGSAMPLLVAAQFDVARQTSLDIRLLPRVHCSVDVSFPGLQPSHCARHLAKSTACRSEPRTCCLTHVVLQEIARHMSERFHC